MVRFSIFLLVILISVTLSAQKKTMSWGDQGNGTYVNPILNADYSDPDVIRVGEKYYMICSDFHYLGMQVLESDDMVNWNISLQTLDGILCHNGELELKEYRPCEMSTFVEYDKKVEACYVDEKAIGELIPCTLEGCVMRICDIIAYLGKDRQDAMRLNLLKESPFTAGAIGTSNGEIINNFSVNIIENSYGKDYLKMDEEYFDALRQAKKENYEMIYNNKSLNDLYENEIRPMFGELYEELLRQAESGDKSSVFYRHHMAYMEKNNFYVKSHVRKPYAEQEKNQLVVDYLASMTDDYFIALYHYLFPKGKHDVKFVGYFDL